MIPELEEIRRKYESGELAPLRDDLERFLIAHRDRIRALQRDRIEKGQPELPPEVAVKLYILQHRTVNPQRDIADQLREIEREKWIRGVDAGAEPDPQKVASEWARRYSAGWRAHRVTSIVYVFEREKERYLRILGTA